MTPDWKTFYFVVKRYDIECTDFSGTQVHLHVVGYKDLHPVHWTRSLKPILRFSVGVIGKKAVTAISRTADCHIHDD
jgi:hypothetical protein